MKKNTKKNVITMLSLALVASAAVGAGVGVVSAKAESTLAKPTGSNAATLTQEIADSDLESFKVYGASVRTKDPAGIRFLTTIESADVAEIPQGAEFGTLIIPQTLLDGELTTETANVLNAVAKVNTLHEDVPADSLGYFITIAGDALATEFPAELYGTVFAARSYVKYTYMPEGAAEAVTDYAYTSETVYRSISYVASKELVKLEKLNTPDTDSESFLNRIIAATTGEMSIALTDAELTAGATTTATVSGATDGVNAFAYNLKTSNEAVAIITADGKVQGVGAGTATISANIGTKSVSADITVNAESVAAYSLAGYNGLSKLTVTFDASSLNADDIAMAELRNANNETVNTVYAKAVDNVATFDMSGVANAEDYNAVITTQKTATPVITDVKADYQETHDLAAIFAYEYASVKAGTSTNVPTGYKWNTKPQNKDYGWLGDTNVTVNFATVGVSADKYTIDENGVYSPLKEKTSRDVKVKITLLGEAKTDAVSVTFTNTMSIDSYFVWQWTNSSSAVMVNLNDNVSGTYTNTILATHASWDGAFWGQTYQKVNNSTMTFGDMVIDYQKTLTVSELVNGNGNPAKVSDGVEKAVYDLSAYVDKEVKTLKATFADTTATTATAELYTADGTIAHTLSGAITDNVASFDVSAIENLSLYTMQIVGNDVVSSVTAEYQTVYDMTQVVKDLYADAVANSATSASKTVDDVAFTFNYLTTRYMVDENGYIRAVEGTSTTNRYNYYDFYWQFNSTDTVAQIVLESTFYKSAYGGIKYYTTAAASYQVGGGEPKSGQTVNYTDTITPTAVMDKFGEAAWTGKIYSRILYRATDTESYRHIKTMTVTYSGAVSASAIYVSAS